jgi:hypothetical protein
VSANGRQPLWGRYFAWLFLYVLLSTLITFLSFAALSANLAPRTVELTTAILTLKAISLAAIIVIGGAELARAPDCPSLLKWINIVVMAYIVVIIIAIIIKIVVGEMMLAVELEGKQLPYPFYLTYAIMQDYGNLIAVSPLVIYAILNILTALLCWLRNCDRKIINSALSFFMVADLPCLIPILGVFLLVTNVEEGGLNENSPTNLFVSGAMAMFILTSNILVLVVRYIVHPTLGIDTDNGPPAGDAPQAAQGVPAAAAQPA